MFVNMVLFILVWKMAFKASRSTETPVYDLWIGNEHNDTVDDCNRHPAKKCDNHYKSSIVDTWENISEVIKYGLKANLNAASETFLYNIYSSFIKTLLEYKGY